MDGNYTFSEEMQNKLRERYKAIEDALTKTCYNPEARKRKVLGIFLDTAYDYAFAAGEADAWRERFKRIEDAFNIHEVTLTKDELRERATKRWPQEWDAR